ncbi:MAG: hypothetical protein COA71_11915 [SAR86 cluster bacterium]|uniref:Uncharacterized protein n=1 Tax=SAR86 cluster bacterium TaxID=2030880 RepID=A0A2A5C8Q9_9GAMM|nr:hypothetical protein [Gammaproteobacteria bacterium AH-315-E17]PCJ40207.1 MAG: hypothetical protein COA71_11915 [SAR86 cluster bacterium]
MEYWYFIPLDSSFFYPLLIALLFAVGFPFINTGIYAITIIAQKIYNKIKEGVLSESKVPYSTFSELRKTYEDSVVDNENDLAKKETQISKFAEENQNLVERIKELELSVNESANSNVESNDDNESEKADDNSNGDVLNDPSLPGIVKVNADQVVILHYLSQNPENYPLNVLHNNIRGKLKGDMIDFRSDLSELVKDKLLQLRTGGYSSTDLGVTLYNKMRKEKST